MLHIHRHINGESVCCSLRVRYCIIHYQIFSPKLFPQMGWVCQAEKQINELKKKLKRFHEAAKTVIILRRSGVIKSITSSKLAHNNELKEPLVNAIIFPLTHTQLNHFSLDVLGTSIQLWVKSRLKQTEWKKSLKNKNLFWMKYFICLPFLKLL